MGSTFMGLETGRRALTTSQWALQATGNNVSNAGTAGFSRQRLVQATTEQLSVSLGGGKNVQFGTGVRGELVERLRDVMVDKQYRDESTKYAYYSTKAAAFGRMEDIINEPSETGLAKTLDSFWASLQGLSKNPQDSGARSVVRQQADTVSKTFNYLATSLTKVQGDLKNELDVSTKKVNDLLQKIYNVNTQIHEIEPIGVLPNDLYDERDRYFDELSTYVDFEKESIDASDIVSGNMGNAAKIAEGRVNVKLIMPGGVTSEVVNMKTDTKARSIEFTTDPTTKAITGYQTDTTPVLFTPTKGFSNGKLWALLQMHGYQNSGETTLTGEYPKMLDNLDKMAKQFAESFNTQHSSHAIVTEDPVTKATVTTKGTDKFFIASSGTEITAKNIAVGSEIWSSLSNIIVSKDGNIGDGSGAQALADIKTKTLSGLGATIGSFYQSIIGDMGVATSQTIDLGKNASVLMDNADQRRMSVSAVSLDEEMTMMIQYQHAYNAAARNITTVDEMLDKIINGMGLVGR
ncbi:flagellar hook-associated protein FlgK [Exiguobacterium acetylicum]|uniref:flagellar hook-associated protein FlgK n=1 Tax=Exiguobacterium sp. BMC-KP TaxID=1684312 RepID=UPI0006AA4534|nr:flagellar hook-associated protein FlgK [Exiguobacterium sp. BMC-KP]KOP30190.1 flagellar hook protein FlgK [Exiguobacterium sp. BMC-KP]